MKKIFLAGLLLSSFFGFSQSYLGLYNFNHVNQSLMVNPASPHNYRFVIAFPGVGGVSTHFNNSAFKLGDLAEKGTDINDRLASVISGLDGTERINLHESIDGLFVGFGTAKGYFTIAATQTADFNMNFPSKLVQFLYFGNVGSGFAGKTLEMNDFNAELILRTNYSIGYQHYIDSNLIIGGRYKYISGIGNTYADKFNFSLYSDVDEITASTDIMFNTAGYSLTESFDANPTDLLMSRNSGMGFDFGVFYRINEKFDISASVIDFGWINWRRDLKGFQSKGSYTFDGIDYNYGDDFEDALNNINDSLQAAFEFKEVEIGEYRTSLPTHIMASGQFHLTPKHVFGLVYQGSMWNNNMYHNYGIQYNGRYGRWFNWIAGYSVIDGIQNNITLGLSLNLGVFQIYMLTENAFAVIEPNSISNTSIRAGINLAFNDKKPKVLEDKNQ